MSDGLAWRYFGTRDVFHARCWAVEGGIAVHENLFRLRGQRMAHLLGPDEATLIVAALTLGCHERWIQRTNTVHFDLMGEFLHRALAHCGRDPAHPPARSVIGASP